MEESRGGGARPRSQSAAPRPRSRRLMPGRPPAAPVPAGETVEPPPSPPLHFMYVAVVALVLLIFVGCGVLLSRKRRRQHGQLWFPEGFKVSEASKKKRREPLGEDSVGLKLVDAAMVSGAWGGAAPPDPRTTPRLHRATGHPAPPKQRPHGGCRGAPTQPCSPAHPQAPEEHLGRRPHG